MKYRGWSGLLALLVAGCAAPRAGAPLPNPLPIPDTLVRGPRIEPLLSVPADSLRRRWAVRPLPVTRAFERAVANGTRTTTGEPGPSYWQQRAEYRIDAELDPTNARLRGTAAIRYHNASPDTLRSLQLMLYQNAFAPDVQRVRRVPVTGGMTLARVAVSGVAVPARSATARAGYVVDGTQLTLPLARPLPPGGVVALELGWSFTVPPRGAPRTGHADRQAYVVAQWYPQVAVYDDVRGWHDLPYWTNGEFYQDYASYDVAITVPAGWTVGATGELVNAEEVLSTRTRERLAQALRQESVVHVLAASELAAGGATGRAGAAKRTWRFRASDVRDFAFAASNRYLWDAARAVLPDANGDGREEVVAVHALYRPEADTWREAAGYMRHALAFHARRWHPYVYPHITAAEGPIGGMEYPMLVFIGAPGSARGLYGVLSHEIAHEWFPMMVGSNETLYAWQDEGTASWMEDLSVADYFPRTSPALDTQEAYLAIADTDQERPLMTPADLFGSGPQYGIAAYSKPASLLRALSHVLDDSVFQPALRTYAEQWRSRHPTPYDLFNTFERVSGRDLDWFWTPWYFETAWLDQAIAAVQLLPGAPGGERVRITVEDLGTAPMPVELVLTLASGDVVRTALPVEPWLAGRRTQTIDIDAPARVTRIDIDPDRWYPDAHRANNAWVRP